MRTARLLDHVWGLVVRGDWVGLAEALRGLTPPLSFAGLDAFAAGLQTK